MTNAEKYLKEGKAHEFSVEFNKYMKKQGYAEEIFQDIVIFLATPVQPTLTEDERVILRNIDKNGKYTTIKRDEDIDLMLSYDDEKLLQTFYKNFDMYNHLFQFIKERRRI